MIATVHYIYDGSFNGLLTVLHHDYKHSNHNQYAVKISESNTQETQELFAEYITIETKERAAEDFARMVSEQLSRRTLIDLYFAYLSRVPEVETLIFQYLKLGLKDGLPVEKLHAHKTVNAVMKLAQRVSRERHRMLGFLRFKKLASNVFYAPMEPDYDVLTLVAPHFTRRLADQSWMIHDMKRGQFALFNTEELIYTDQDLPTDQLPVAKEEQFFQDLWKEYFHNVSIEDRKNTKRQQQFLPKKYWKHLTEKQGPSV